jgi:hypothetical protein
MVGHGVGLVTCLTLIKDYKADAPQLKGLGTQYGKRLVRSGISIPRASARRRFRARS